MKNENKTFPTAKKLFLGLILASLVMLILIYEIVMLGYEDGKVILSSADLLWSFLSITLISVAITFCSYIIFIEGLEDD